MYLGCLLINHLYFVIYFVAGDTIWITCSKRVQTGVRLSNSKGGCFSGEHVEQAISYPCYFRTICAFLAQGNVAFQRGGFPDSLAIFFCSRMNL